VVFSKKTLVQPKWHWRKEDYGITNDTAASFSPRAKKKMTESDECNQKAEIRDDAQENAGASLNE